jgi:hypothetical protein
MGVFSGIPTTSHSILFFFDEFESRYTEYIGLDGTALPTPPIPPLAADAIFSDGFESGNTSAWSAVTDTAAQLSVATGAKIVGTYGLSANIASNTAAYVTNWTPWAEPHYRAEFQFLPHGTRGLGRGSTGLT